MTVKWISCFALSLLAGCASGTSRRDGGATGVDAGVSPVSDAGMMLAGSDGGTMTVIGPDGGNTMTGADGGTALTLDVQSNPNDVLSAVAMVSWTGPLRSVSISYAGGSTPVTDVSSRTSPVTLPILGLHASTSYAFQASGTDNSGTPSQSNSVSLTTGALPAGIPTFITSGTQTAGAYTLVARIPLSESLDDYLTVVDGSGHPVWYYRLPSDGMGGDFQQQPDGTFTVGRDDLAHTIPGLTETVCVYDQVDVLGNLVHSWTALDAPSDTKGNPVKIAATDCHEIRILPDGSALLFGFTMETKDLSAYGGSATANVASTVMERVTADGHVLFAWNASDYLDASEVDSTATSLKSSTVDFDHANSIDVLPDGNYLISLRNLSVVLKIDSGTGDILWKLGGAGLSTPSGHGPTGDFKFVDGPLGGFSCQHGARALPNGHILLFDDGDGHHPPASRAVEYALDTTQMTATEVWSTPPTMALYTFILGYAQRLSNGDTLVSYGVANQLHEFDSGGLNVVWSLTDPRADSGTSGTYGLYRAYRMGSLYSYSPP